MEILKIKKNDAGQRLDKFLSKAYPTLPATLIYKYLRKKKIKLNGSKALGNSVLCEGDEIVLHIPVEFTDEIKSSFDFPFMRIKNPLLSAAYEDDNILIADKKAGICVHSDSENDTDTLIENIKAYLYQKGEYNPKEENSFAPALCNRIDRNTSGLVIAAKNADTLREMNDIIKNRDLTKKYLAAVKGRFDVKSGRLSSFIRKLSDENRVIVKSVKTDREDKTAITDYKVLAYNEEMDISLLEITLVTGRTHQIRAQFAAANHPLLGDGKYSKNKSDRADGFTHQALCSYSLTFDFKEDHGNLQYLKGKTVKAESPFFLKYFKVRF